MKSKNLILGYFHKCGNDDEHFGWISSFLSDNAEFDSEVLLQTENSMVLAFAADQDEEWFEKRWKEFVPNIPVSMRPAFFDHVSDLSLLGLWKENVPYCFEEISKRLSDQ